MCGIFGYIGDNVVDSKKLIILSKFARNRGFDSSGIIYYKEAYYIDKANYDISKLIRMNLWKKSKVVFGHSRLVTNGLNDNQPVFRNSISVIHNGIVVNEHQLWDELKHKTRLYEIDSEVICALAEHYYEVNNHIEGVGEFILSKCVGSVSAVLIFHELGKVVLFSNTGSLYSANINEGVYFSSESHPLKSIGGKLIKQIKNYSIVFDLPKEVNVVEKSYGKIREIDLIPKLKNFYHEKELLQFNKPNLIRCSKCILPNTFPFIQFDSNGVCNYCNQYTPKNHNKSLEKLKELVEPYRSNGPADCIIPFSGGRDSCYTLHLAVKELGLKPITYTYDWGMVTDLARRNISRMCSELGVENIIIAADIEKKRRNIRKNLKAWLKRPHLGMVNIFMAGDKHFFKYNHIVKRQNNISLELWGINSLEKTHFKTGFLGLPPIFKSESYYVTDIRNQLRYQYLRLKEYIKNPSYFNLSLWDTITGEYYRTIKKKKDYYHVFDFMAWNEDEINKTLLDYGFEMAIDTKSSWRIGDGTAAFYNYIYYTVAGFSEHDTFRSNQIREGLIDREKALELVYDENKPRYENIRWYLDTLDLNYSEVISIVNQIPKLY